MTARKQPGRRYGPAPTNPPHFGMQAPPPMSYGDRATIYARQPDGPTHRQAKQMRRMAELRGELVRLDNKGATPKQKKVRG